MGQRSINRCCSPGAAGSQIATRPSPWWLSAKVANTRFPTKNVGAPCESRSLLSGRLKQIARTRSTGGVAIATGPPPPRPKNATPAPAKTWSSPATCPHRIGARRRPTAKTHCRVVPRDAQRAGRSPDGQGPAARPEAARTAPGNGRLGDPGPAGQARPRQPQLSRRRLLLGRGWNRRRAGRVGRIGLSMADQGFAQRLGFG